MDFEAVIQQGYAMYTVDPDARGSAARGGAAAATRSE